MATYLAHFIAPATEYRFYRKVQGENEDEVRKNALKLAEEMAEGWELTEIEEIYE